MVFSSPKDEADVNKVEGCFGATHPGGYSFLFMDFNFFDEYIYLSLNETVHFNDDFN